GRTGARREVEPRVTPKRLEQFSLPSEDFYLFRRESHVKSATQLQACTGIGRLAAHLITIDRYPTNRNVPEEKPRHELRLKLVARIIGFSRKLDILRPDRNDHFLRHPIRDRALHHSERNFDTAIILYGALKFVHGTQKCPHTPVVWKVV